jgi:hypothetical protein
MNITRINTNNNFGAYTVGKLQEEIERKKINKETIETIKNLVPNAKVDIDKENSTLYNVSIYGNTFYIRRENDEKTSDYASLIKGLKYIKENYSCDK